MGNFRKENFLLQDVPRIPLPLSRRVALGMERFWAHFFSDRLCPVCHKPYYSPSPQKTRAVQNFLCASCAVGIEPISFEPCALCGHALPQGVSMPICIACQRNPPPWQSLHYYGPYSSLLKALVLQYKYGKDFSLIPLLVAFLYETSLSLPICDILIPMPRHEKRLAEQGYNQILELCRVLQDWMVLPLDTRALYRTRYTPPQAGLRKRERQNNPRESFAARDVQGKKVLLVDDVMTTGATVYHACLALQKAKVASITVLLLARAEK